MTLADNERARLWIIVVGLNALWLDLAWYGVLFLAGALPLLWWTREPIR